MSWKADASSRSQDDRARTHSDRLPVDGTGRSARLCPYHQVSVGSATSGYHAFTIFLPRRCPAHAKPALKVGGEFCPNAEATNGSPLRGYLYRERTTAAGRNH